MSVQHSLLAAVLHTPCWVIATRQSSRKQPTVLMNRPLIYPPKEPPRRIRCYIDIIGGGGDLCLPKLEICRSSHLLLPRWILLVHEGSATFQQQPVGLIQPWAREQLLIILLLSYHPCPLLLTSTAQPCLDVNCSISGSYYVWGPACCVNCRQLVVS